MNVLADLARVTTATTGTGTITLGPAVSGFLTLAQAGVADGSVVTYAIADGANAEIGQGTYTASGTTLTRTTIYRSTGTGNNTAISLSGSAQVFITVAAEDLSALLAISGITGLLKATAGVVSQAIAGTDYAVAAATLTLGSTTLTLGGTVTSVSGLTLSGGTLTGTITIPSGQITSTGALLINNATAISVAGSSAGANRLQVYNDPSVFVEFAASTAGVLNYLGKSRGSVSAAGVVVTGDYIGRIIFAGDDGSTNGAIPIKGAEYSTACSDTISTGVVPMRHVWGTMNSGGTYVASRMILFSSGGLSVNSGTDPGVGVINANNGLTAGGVKVAPTNPVQKSVATVTGTTSTTGVMMGLAAAITPAATVGTGNLLINVCGDCFNATAIADGGTITIRYGTGTAPANAAALTGTVVGGAVIFVQATSAERHPFALNAVVTGLTLGTAYWIDVSLAALTGGTATIENVSVSIIEI